MLTRPTSLLLTSLVALGSAPALAAQHELGDALRREIRKEVRKAVKEAVAEAMKAHHHAGEAKQRDRDHHARVRGVPDALREAREALRKVEGLGEKEIQGVLKALKKAHVTLRSELPLVLRRKAGDADVDVKVEKRGRIELDTGDGRAVRIRLEGDEKPEVEVLEREGGIGVFRIERDDDDARHGKKKKVRVEVEKRGGKPGVMVFGGKGDKGHRVFFTRPKGGKGGGFFVAPGKHGKAKVHQFSLPGGKGKVKVRTDGEVDFDFDVHVDRDHDRDHGERHDVRVIKRRKRVWL